MTKQYNLSDLKEFSYNPFSEYISDKIFDSSLIDSFSKTAKNIIKYLIYKHSFTKEKFLFNIDEFKKFTGCVHTDNLSDGLAELCAKELLAKTNALHIYWVNNKLFNTGVFKPQYIKSYDIENQIINKY